jgi:outer membrane protein assembly factor BamB
MVNRDWKALVSGVVEGRMERMRSVKRVASRGCSWGALALGLPLLLTSGWADPWPAYRGNAGTGISQETGWNLPRSNSVVWKAEVGTGTTSVVAAADRLWVSGYERGQDVIRCLDAGHGREIWRYAMEATLDPNLFEGGPRATPTLAEDRLYVLGHEGALVCLDAAKGTKLWEKHLIRELGGRKPEWGYSGAPLVYGELLILDVGGNGSSTVALNRRNGAVVWSAGVDRAGYASPVVFPLAGVPTLLVFKAEGLVGYDPAQGQERWRFPWKTAYQIHAATPLPLGPDRVLISSGYNTGAAALRVAADGVQLLWSNKNLRAHINSPVFLNGAIFGIDGNTGGGNLVCLDPQTGEKRWEEKSVKGGALVAVGGKLVMVSEKGELIVAEADASRFRALAREWVLSRRTWAQPTLAEGRLFLRDNLGNLVCLDLR